MQPTETLQTTPPIVEKMKVEMGEKKGWVDRLKTSIGDTIRDVVTASEMAKDQFDGDSAILRVARGGMTVAIGLGLEKAIDTTWQQAFAGKIKIFHRPEVTIDAEALKKLEAIGLTKGKAGASFYYLVREGTKDLMIGLLYNGLAFFSRPMLPSVEGKHLVASAAVNAVEALFEYPQNIHLDIYDTKGIRNDPIDLNDNKKPDSLVRIKGWTTRNVLLTLLRGSNPPTQLGLGMMKDGWDRFRKNFKEVRRVRKEKGGLPGKSVHMPKDEHRGRREERRQHDHKDDKVYYGRSHWQQGSKKQGLRPDEEALEKFS